MSPVFATNRVVIEAPVAVNFVVRTPFQNILIVPVTGLFAAVKLVLLPLILPEGVSLVIKLDAVKYALNDGVPVN